MKMKVHNEQSSGHVSPPNDPPPPPLLTLTPTTPSHPSPPHPRNPTHLANCISSAYSAESNASRVLPRALTFTPHLPPGNGIVWESRFIPDGIIENRTARTNMRKTNVLLQTLLIHTLPVDLKMRSNRPCFRRSLKKSSACLNTRVTPLLPEQEMPQNSHLLTLTKQIVKNSHLMSMNRCMKLWKHHSRLFLLLIISIITMVLFTPETAGANCNVQTCPLWGKQLLMAHHGVCAFSRGGQVAT